jgi:hypothetical protein
MKTSYFLVLPFVAFMFGNTVEAQCLKCVPVTISHGACDEVWPSDGYCDRGCCGEYIGKLCNFPDFSDPCFPSFAREASLLRLPTTPDGKAPYFVTRKPIEKQQEHLYRRLQSRDPVIARCGRNTGRI